MQPGSPGSSLPKALPLKVTGQVRPFSRLRHKKALPGCFASEGFARTQEGHRVGVGSGVLGDRPAGASGAPPQEIAKPEQDEDRSDRAQAGDDVVDGGDEVVRGVTER